MDAAGLKRKREHQAADNESQDFPSTPTALGKKLARGYPHTISSVPAAISRSQGQAGRTSTSQTLEVPADRHAVAEAIDAPPSLMAVARARVLHQADRASAFAHHKETSRTQSITSDAREEYDRLQVHPDIGKDRKWSARPDSFGSVATGANLTSAQWASVRARWPSEDEDKLLEARRRGLPWKEIGELLPHRGYSACVSYYARLTQGDKEGGVLLESVDTQRDDDTESSNPVREHRERNLETRETGAETQVSIVSNATTLQQVSAYTARMFVDLPVGYRSTATENAHQLFQYHGEEVSDFSDLAMVLEHWRSAVEFCPPEKIDKRPIRLCIPFSMGVADYNSQVAGAIGKVRWGSDGNMYYFNGSWTEEQRRQYRSQSPFQRSNLLSAVTEWLWRKDPESAGPAVLPIIAACAMPVIGQSKKYLAELKVPSHHFQGRQKRCTPGPLILIHLPFGTGEVLFTDFLDINKACVSGSQTGGTCTKANKNGLTTTRWTFARSAAYDRWSLGKTVKRQDDITCTILQKLSAVYSAAEQGEAPTVALEQWGDVRERLL
ncbi:hypothetical protein LTR37_014095 [Vermiconidia calcicola]|uniref:Uncharacterized protein n=1 Tax=Vermiconidia calcicola TaxID=1690605 RepID=A0ACC3MW11_9PEZI|nr:hypothetical protein LTR37_014095 [Vermiconidia calcicola]